MQGSSALGYETEKRGRLYFFKEFFGGLQSGRAIEAALASYGVLEESSKLVGPLVNVSNIWEVFFKTFKAGKALNSHFGF